MSVVRRRIRADRGATLVEAAVITPLLMLLVFGVFEFGFAFRDYLTVANATRDGAREASVAGNVTDADYRMLQAIESSAAVLPDAVIERIVVFEASGPLAVVSDTCKSGTAVANVCNVYDSTSLSLAPSQFGCQEVAAGDPLDSPDRFWCPNTREVSAGNGLDYVGVYVKITHSYITGMFGSSIDFEDQMILKVEPQEL